MRICASISSVARALPVGLMLATLGGAAGAAPNPVQLEGRAAALQALSQCRAEKDPGQRLACFDAAAARLDEAEQKGDIVVVDRRQAQEVRRQAFGFTLPSLSLFERAEGEARLDRVESVIAEARRGPDGKWLLRLENGAVWRQTDAEGPARTPRKGMKAVVRSAALGSFLVSVDGQAAFRAKREE